MHTNISSVRALLYCAIVCLPAAGSAQNEACCASKPPIRPIDRTCLPSGTSPCNLPLYRGDILAKYQQIAYVDSFYSLDNCADTVRKQLKDLQAKGRAAGADALIRVRVLKNQVRGWQEDPHTPFVSVHQGESQDYFFRATAIKYLEWPQGEPEAVAIVAAPDLSGKAKPGLSPGSLFKTRKSRREERFDRQTLPEVQATQPLGAPL